MPEGHLTNELIYLIAPVVISTVVLFTALTVAVLKGNKITLQYRSLRVEINH